MEAQTWQKIVAKYQTPHVGRGTWQLINTLIPYAAAWFFAVKCWHISFWLALPFIILAGGLLVRTFIIFHDCGHGSFFKSQKANNFWGFVTGVLTLTPYQHWRHEHALHHSHAGDLDHRGTGDVWTMTVQEYLNSPFWTRVQYRIARNPICLFLIAPIILFLIVHRLPIGKFARGGKQSVHMTNLALVLVGLTMGSLIGLKLYLIIQFLVILIAGSAGVWLFYVQHQFEGVYWERHEHWDYVTEALKGSSFFKLPRILQWFTGNIGFHHIHHLSPRIPNYFLERCHRENPMFQEVRPITFWESFRSLNFRLWDEENQRLVGFAYVRNFKRCN